MSPNVTTRKNSEYLGVDFSRDVFNKYDKIQK